MGNLAVIPARSGSKEIKDKNIKQLCHLPLMAYSIRAAQESGIFDEIMVSTDSFQYAEIAMTYGAAVPFLRSKELSEDQSGSWDVVKEVLFNYQKMQREFDTVCLLQPTSPLRTGEDIINGYKVLCEKQADAITSVCETTYSPLWSMSLADDMSLKEFRKHMNDMPRQQLCKFYRINGAVYIRKIQYSDTDIKLLVEKEYAFVMEKTKSVDIDTMEDFAYAKFLMGLTDY